MRQLSNIDRALETIDHLTSELKKSKAELDRHKKAISFLVTCARSGEFPHDETIDAILKGDNSK